MIKYIQWLYFLAYYKGAKVRSVKIKRDAISDNAFNYLLFAQLIITMIIFFVIGFIWRIMFNEKIHIEDTYFFISMFLINLVLGIIIYKNIKVPKKHYSILKFHLKNIDQNKPISFSPVLMIGIVPTSILIVIIVAYVAVYAP